MGRRRVEIKRIEDKSKRQTSFTKRRAGLRKKAGDYVDMFGGEVAIIAFSNAGNCFGYGNPSVISVINRYLALTAADTPENNNNQEYSDPVAGLGDESETNVTDDDLKTESDIGEKRHCLDEYVTDDDLKSESEIGENSTDESEAEKEMGENAAGAERVEEEEEIEKKKKRRQRAMWEKAIEDSNIGELERWKAHLEEVKLKLEKILESKSLT